MTAPANDTADDCPLEGPAADLWRDANARWDLDPCSKRILRSACESLMTANRAEALISEEGIVVTDRTGRVSKHPAVNVARDARAAYTGALARLKLDLE